MVLGLLRHVTSSFFSIRILKTEILVYNSYFFRTAVLRKLFDLRFSYKHCNFSRVCLLVMMVSKTVTRSNVFHSSNRRSIMVSFNTINPSNKVICHAKLSFWRHTCVIYETVCVNINWIIFSKLVLKQFFFYSPKSVIFCIF